VIALAYGRGESLRCAAQHLVADDVAVVVVDELEVVEVEHGDCHRPQPAVGEDRREVLHQREPVAKPGERVAA
jgi:hypothetical protein